MKKVLISVLTAILALSVFNTAAYANELPDKEKEISFTNESVILSTEKIIDRIEKVDAKILKEIEKAQAKAEGLTDAANESEIDEIVKHLLDKTNKMAQNLIEKGEKDGITIYADYIYVTIGDREEVPVDPCRITPVSD